MESDIQVILIRKVMLTKIPLFIEYSFSVWGKEMKCLVEAIYAFLLYCVVVCVMPPSIELPLRQMQRNN